ncbi:MAG: RIP metalloprotease RseP [Candidatus Zixiibacteriota bacterium]|nr:MAG: RIP metalloprotease RseP [candidate division Zixibacteria bacterium]
MLLTAVTFIFVLGILIFIHELGHFLLAKRVGIKVERFSLGFPPDIISRKYGDTTYSIGMIPLGGYVKMAAEHPHEEATGAPDEFMSRTVGERAAVIFAGPFMNYVLSIVLLIGIFLFAGRAVFDESRIVVGEVNDGSPAQMADLRVDDVIIAVNGEYVTRFDSLRSRINAVVNSELDLTWLRGQDTIMATLTTAAQEVPNLDGRYDTVGIIGISEKVIGYESYSIGESISQGFVTAHVIVWETVKFIKKLVTGEVSAKLIGGPIFIAQQSGKEVRKGAANLFFFMALLSVNLAVLNVLPIPILDGGHLVFLFMEKIKGSPVSVRARVVAQQIGLFLLLGLILVVTYNDILRWIRGL